ncbi:carph-isopro domain-containing protein [Azospirillum agricola]|uniref:carph-isopro domain-containing protein n=1 Tax=Azospirillum agricola TaxID=1720247 RepID=UPI000A0EF64D|nr:mitofilin family membrane protein [Azospirillum agricola]SMH57235.1 inner membrane protein [Azospirillum lipoferum]
MTSRPGSDRPTPEQDGDANAASSGTPTSAAAPNAGSSAVDRIVERFGGIRPMAHKVDIPVTTVQGWKKRGAIPLARHADLRAAAAKHRIKLSDADLDAATPSEDRTAAEGAIAATGPSASPTDVIIVPPAPTAVGDDTLPGATTAPETAPDVAIPPAQPADTIPAAGADTPVAGETATDSLKAENAKADTPAGPAVGPIVEPITPTLDPDAPKLDGAKLDGAKTDEAKPDIPKATSYTKPEDVGPPRIATATPAPSAYLDEPRSGGGFATALSIVALLVGAAALAEPWWGPRLPGWPATAAAPATPAAVAPPADPALRAQVQQLADRLGKLEQRPAAPAGDGAATAAPADTSGLEASLRQLAERIDGLEKRPVAAPAEPAEPDPRVGQLTERFGAIEQRLTAVAGNSQAAQDLRRDLDAVKQQIATVNQTVETRRDAATAAQALVLAAGQLRSSLAAGQPFQQDLQGVRALGIADAGVTQPLDTVAPFAAKGIPTQAQLTDRFRPLASEIVRAAERGDGSTWIDQVTGKLATLVTVRRQGGGVVGTSPDAIVARAEAAVNENNLAKAVEELSALQGAGAATAAPWLADAKARLAADQAGRQLTERAIALLNTAAGGAAGGKGAAQ